jgi:hypothetical protein
VNSGKKKKKGREVAPGPRQVQSSHTEPARTNRKEDSVGREERKQERQQKKEERKQEREQRREQKQEERQEKREERQEQRQQERG